MMRRWRVVVQVVYLLAIGLLVVSSIWAWTVTEKARALNHQLLSLPTIVIRDDGANTDDIVLQFVNIDEDVLERISRDDPTVHRHGPILRTQGKLVVIYEPGDSILLSRPMPKKNGFALRVPNGIRILYRVAPPDDNVPKRNPGKEQVF